MMATKLLLPFLLVVNSVFCAQDVPCLTPRGLPGTCVPLGQCKRLEKIILKRFSYLSTNDKSEFLTNWRCANTTNGVCCPRRKANRRSVPVEQHRNYKLLPSLNDCGTSSSDRLYSGNKTLPMEYPWMALIETGMKYGEIETKRKTRNFHCGGTVINSRYILTAAHCITKLKNATVIGVRLGEHDISTDRDCISPNDCAPPVKDIAVEKIIPHPQFKGLVGTWYDTRNDIGLIRLAQAIDFDDDDELITPICMPVTKEMRQKNLDKLQLIVTGWGRTNSEEDKERATDQLLQIRIPIAPNNSCETRYKSFTVGQICAGGQKATGTCVGDSGGPLMYYGRFSSPKRIKYVQYGIVSAGLNKCAQEGKPTVFTSVAHHLKWILDQLEP